MTPEPDDLLAQAARGVRGREAARRRSIDLSTLGSRIHLDVEPSALVAGGAVLRLHLHDGPLAVTFTPAEARWLTGALAETVHPKGE